MVDFRCADLVVLSADPAQDVTAFSRVRYTIRDGTIIYSRPDVAPRAAKRNSK
jgi:imidazolonepropionase-like amidohydrolase